MKVIFLDFDGVITIPPKWNLEPNRIAKIKKLVEETGAKIVVSSSWRHGLKRNFKWELEDNANNDDHTNNMIAWLRDNIYDITPNVGLGYGRGGEIQKWLNEHLKEIENYVILDDDSDMWPSQFFHFVQTDYQTGFTEHEYDLAYRILTNKYIYNTIGLNFELRDRWRKKCEGNEELWQETIKYNDLTQDFNNR